MTEEFEAIFENGVFRPTQPIEGLPEHTRVRVSVDIPGPSRSRLTDCVGTLPDADAAELLEIIASEFERVDARDWD